MVGQEQITISDWLIVSLGDSVASGEGAPELPNPRYAGWQDTRCHRSAFAGPAVAAHDIAKRYPRISVTFVSLACSGATIAKGLLGPYRGIAERRGLPKLEPQVEQLNEIAEIREPDTVLISIGANDVGFSKVVKWCALVPHIKSCFGWLRRRKLTSRLEELPAKYAELAHSLHVPPARVYLTEYFDPTGDASGATCKGILKPPLPGTGLVGLKQIDLDEARKRILTPLNERIAAAVRLHGWNEITGIAHAFRNHGYCAEDGQSWITTLRESFDQQGGLGLPTARFAGALHPNKEGQHQIATLIEGALVGSACAAKPGGRLPVAYTATITPPTAIPTCLSPLPVYLPLPPIAMAPATAAAISLPAWILIGLGAGALLLALVFVAWRILPATTPRLRIRAATRRARLRRAMGAKSWSTQSLVVVCLGVALVVFFAGATAAVAAGQVPPTALWAAGGAVSGALIGLLVPAPGSKKALEEAATAAKSLATEATGEAATHAERAAGAEGAVAAAHKVKAKAAEAVAQQATADARAHTAAAASTPDTGTATATLAGVFFLLLALSLILAGGLIAPAKPFQAPLLSFTTAIVALTSATGSALIGILAPSPGKGS